MDVFIFLVIMIDLQYSEACLAHAGQCLTDFARRKWDGHDFMNSKIIFMSIHEIKFIIDKYKYLIYRQMVLIYPDNEIYIVVITL